MSATLKIKANDTLPLLRFVLADKQGVYVIPETATVALHIKGMGLLHSVACGIESRAAGIVTYDRSGPECALPGNYSFEFEVTIAPSGKRTFPTDGFLSVTVEPDLN